MAIDVVVETRIGRPIDAVYAELIDLDRWPEWLVATGIQRIARSTAGPAVEGERLVIDQAAAGRHGTFQGSVTRVEAPTHLSIAGKDGDGVTIEITAKLVPVDAVQSVLRFEIRIALPFRLRIFEGLARPQVERAVEADVERFRRRLASVADD
jgi:uncharacterized protein YndB with AHSA1/START domain